LIIQNNIDEEIKNSVSSFGHIPYGHKIEGRLLFDINNELGCEKFNREAREDPIVGESPFVMVRQGDCSLFDKVKNIEKAGGYLAIIISDKDEKIEEGIFLGEEGLSSDITIPALLISKNDGKILIDYYKKHAKSHEEIKDIRLEVKFENEKLDNTVQYDVWYSPDQENAYIFFKDFKSLQETLGESAILGIHSFSYPHFSYTPDEKQNIKNCLGSGLYCIRPGKVGVTDGTNVLKESIRQKCIYINTFNDKNKKKQKLYWEYMETFYEKCVKARKIDKSCSDEVIKKVGLSEKDIQNCYKKSFVDNSEDNYEIYSKNIILDRDYELRKKYFITKSPSITINDRVYLGSWKAENVFESLCASLIDKPESCYMEVTFDRDINGITLTGFLIIIFFVIVINIVLFLVCKRMIKNGIQEKVDSSGIEHKIDNMVDSYLALKDSAPGED
jgi:hypothetical protein